MTQPSQTKFQCGALAVSVHADLQDMARSAAALAAVKLEAALAARGEARAILATGNSQIAFLEALIAGQGTSWTLDWSKITLFHMDEYLGLPDSHPASFRKYMKDRVESRLKPKAFHYIEGDALEPIAECERYSGLLSEKPIDLCCLGIGENGHLAFNDPPVANFTDPRLVKIVKLDEACRQQQVGEGHFQGVDAVPQYAISLTIPALCQVGYMLAIVPEKRKATAVLNSLTGPISTACPGSHLRTIGHCTLFLDADSASLLPETIGTAQG
jgi:glucosamine-6-phosphate deaminase